jgi:hypothetical protein
MPPAAPSDAEIEQALRAYRKSRFTIICHAAFLALCIIATVVARRAMGLPPQLLTTVIIVALILFAKDIMTFFRLRSEVAKLRARFHQ